MKGHEVEILSNVQALQKIVWEIGSNLYLFIHYCFQLAN